MKQTKRLMLVVMAVCLCFLVSCSHHDEVLSTTTSPPNKVSDQGAIRTNADYQRTKEAALLKSQKEYEEMVRHPEMITNRPSSEWHFPNFQTGPGRPLPNYVNFYTMDDRFSSYLLCEYAVKEDHYDQSKESEWFKGALDQVRQSGSAKFPPIQWIAVAVRNVAEHKDVSTFEQSFKVAAIFKASDVFDSLRDLSQLVAGAELDRHPFKYDLQQPTPGEQQRWVIVERHAATNQISANSSAQGK